MANLLPINTQAPDSRMHEDVAGNFNALRQSVLSLSGVDFLAKCGDVLRPAGFQSAKPGVANRSWHKTGRAFDYDQENAALMIQAETANGQQFFRTFLKCSPQDGSLGESRRVVDIRGYAQTAYFVDFTFAAAAMGFHRIPAWKGWSRNYNLREFWHYQRDEGLTWAAAMAQINDRPSSQLAVIAGGTIGLNDRDSNTAGGVRKIQQALYLAGLLKSDEIDGIFGGKTFAAVKRFQSISRLSIDGIVGPQTARLLGIAL